MKISQAKMERAITQTTQYLQALKIPFTLNQNTIHIEANNGTTVTVAIVKDENPVEGAELTVSAAAIANKNFNVAMDAFGDITEMAGYGRPAPVNRGKVSAGKLHFSENFELVAMRHREFHKVPNPSPQKYLEYKSTIEKAVRVFMFNKRYFLAKFGIEQEDLLQYARVWAANFFGLYEAVGSTEQNRHGRLYNHLTQRFYEFLRLLHRKSRSCTPPTPVCRLGMGLTEYSEPFDNSMDPCGDEQSESLQDLNHRQMVRRRRKAASELLNKLLAEMPHDTLVEKLKHIASDPESGAQAEAVRRLAIHKNECTKCSVLEENE